MSQRSVFRKERDCYPGNWVRDLTRDAWIAPNGRRFTSVQLALARETPAAFVAMMRAGTKTTSEPEPKPETPRRRLYTKD